MSVKSTEDLDALKEKGQSVNDFDHRKLYIPDDLDTAAKEDGVTAIYEAKSRLSKTLKFLL